MRKYIRPALIAVIERSIVISLSDSRTEETHLPLPPNGEVVVTSKSAFPLQESCPVRSAVVSESNDCSYVQAICYAEGGNGFSGGINGCATSSSS